MKSSIALTAILCLAGLALAGCTQNSPDSSTDTQTARTNLSVTGGTTGVGTNAPATNSLPDLNTNAAPASSMPEADTNAPAGTNY